MATLHDSRTLAAWLAASVVVHIAVVLALPVVRMIEESRPTVLDVTLQQIEPPRVLPTPPEPKPAPPLREKPAPRKEARRVPVPDPVPQREPPPAAAREPTPAPPIIAIPQTESPVRVPAPEADTTPRQEAPRAAPSVGKTDAASRDPAPAGVTPPTFNAAYLRNPPPRYPVSARRNGEQGTVTLRVFVTREGVPATVGVHTTSGSSTLDQAAVEAVRSWRFTPARQGPEPVEAWVLVPIVFKLDGVS
jgi:periplasmic protein TonB